MRLYDDFHALAYPLEIAQDLDECLERLPVFVSCRHWIEIDAETQSDLSDHVTEYPVGVISNGLSRNVRFPPISDISALGPLSTHCGH